MRGDYEISCYVCGGLLCRHWLQSEREEYFQCEDCGTLQTLREAKENNDEQEVYKGRDTAIAAGG